MLNTEKRRAVRIPDEMRVKLYAYTPQPLRCALAQCVLRPARTPCPAVADVQHRAITASPCDTVLWVSGM